MAAALLCLAHSEGVDPGGGGEQVVLANDQGKTA